MEESIIGRLQAELERRANEKTKAFWNGYLKGTIPFRGVPMGEIRSALHHWLETEGIQASLSPHQRLDLALALIRQEHGEDKLVGILYLQEVLIPTGSVACPLVLECFAALFREGYINEWNTCDWFCVRVLGPLVERHGEQCARAIASWKDAEGLWQRRAAGVAFVNLAKRGEANFLGFTDMLLEVCDATVRSPERFAQTGTGWLLRELSLAAPERVVLFLEDHIGLVSSEGLNYAVEKLPAEVRARLKQAKKAVPRDPRPMA